MGTHLLRVLRVATYPANLVAAATYTVILVATNSAWLAIAVAIAVGAAHETACVRAGRRLGWPWRTPGAVAFERHLELRRELARLRAEGRMLERATEAMRTGTVEYQEYTVLDVTVTDATTTDDTIVFDVRFGANSFLDLTLDGERRRIHFSGPPEKPTDPALHERWATVVAEYRDATQLTLRARNTVDNALLIDSLRTEPGHIVVITDATGTHFELGDATGHRRLTFTA